MLSNQVLYQLSYRNLVKREVENLYIYCRRPWTRIGRHLFYKSSFQIKRSLSVALRMATQLNKDAIESKGRGFESQRRKVFPTQNLR